jgi:hypothetical protein
MCVIITSPRRGARPSLQQLELCERTNPHGSGVAWIEGKRVEYAKSLPIAEIHRLLEETAGPAIIHFRIASVGGVDPQLCHPFPITHGAELRATGRARSVLFHNGTWAEWKRAAEKYGIGYAKREPVSDTRIAASLVARFGFDWLKRVGADYCRWAHLDNRGIQRLGDWKRLGGCHYSNTFWLPRSRDWSDGFLYDDEMERDDRDGGPAK